jgi:hypothetical protein
VNPRRNMVLVKKNGTRLIYLFRNDNKMKNTTNKQTRRCAKRSGTTLMATIIECMTTTNVLGTIFVLEIY